MTGPAGALTASPSPPLARGLLEGRAAGRLSGCGLGPTTPDHFITFAAADMALMVPRAC